MIKAGGWGKDKCQIHNFYGIDELDYGRDKVEIKVRDNYLSNSLLKGSVALSEKEKQEYPEFMSDAGTMSWDLKATKQLQFDVGFGSSRLFRRLNAFEMYWHIEGMKTIYEGIVECNGKTYDIIPEKSYGYQDKNWGGDYTSPWIWLNCNNIKYKGTDETLQNTSFDLGGGRPVVFGKPLQGRILTMFYHEGKKYEYNFTKIWDRVKQEFNFLEGDKIANWKVTSQNKNSKLEINMYCKKDEMILVNYENPDGEKLHNKLYNGGTAYGTIKLFEREKEKYKLKHEFDCYNCGCEYGEY